MTEIWRCTFCLCRLLSPCECHNIFWCCVIEHHLCLSSLMFRLYARQNDVMDPEMGHLELSSVTDRDSCLLVLFYFPC